MDTVGKFMKTKYGFVLFACVFIGLFPGSSGGGTFFSAQRSNVSPSQALSGLQIFDSDAGIKTQQVQSGSLRFAVIGDYGSDSEAEADVAILVKSWDPDIIVTTGDNNYNNGSADTIDKNIGKYYREFIYPYKGSYGEGAQINRLFPSLGNHDWNTTDAQPYLDYFTLPGNERYYDFTWGAVHFFVLDSDANEPDGISSTSVQAAWLKSQLANSSYPWKIVVLHHAPYSSGDHGSNVLRQWPFADWGADVILAGHDHTYERITQDGILYFVNGLGGKSIYGFPDIVDGSQLRYNEDYGAMLVDVSIGKIRFRFINRQGVVIDDIDLVKPLSYWYLPHLQQKSP